MERSVIRQNDFKSQQTQDLEKELNFNLKICHHLYVIKIKTIISDFTR